MNKNTNEFSEILKNIPQNIGTKTDQRKCIASLMVAVNKLIISHINGYITSMKNISEFMVNPESTMEEGVQKFMGEYKAQVTDGFDKEDQEKINQLLPANMLRFLYKKMILATMDNATEPLETSDTSVKIQFYCQFIENTDDYENALNYMNNLLTEYPLAIKRMKEDLIEEITDAVLDDYNSKKLSKESMETILKAVKGI